MACSSLMRRMKELFVFAGSSALTAGQTVKNTSGRVVHQNRQHATQIQPGMRHHAHAVQPLHLCRHYQDQMQSMSK